MKNSLSEFHGYFSEDSHKMKAISQQIGTSPAFCGFLAENNRLQAGGNRDNLASTTTFNRHRNRYTSGIFLPKIHQINGNTKPLIYSEFAVRATRRNKMGNHTNNADCLKAVVEPLSHPFSDKPLSLTKTFKTMLYKFLSIQGDKRLKITVYANSKAEALNRIQWLNNPLCIVSNLKAQGGVDA